MKLKGKIIRKCNLILPQSISKQRELGEDVYHQFII